MSATPQKDSDDSELHLVGFQGLLKVQREKQKQLEVCKASFAKLSKLARGTILVKIHYSSC